MVTFAAASGEVVAIVGRNGSGKSTLLRTLATLVLPDGGSATVAGFDVVVEEVEVRRRVAFVTADDRSFHLRLTGRENLEFFAGLHGATPVAVNTALEQVSLVDVAGDSFATYSSGMRQRLALARGLMTRPSVLLLDEPFRALDAESSDALRAAIGRAADDGATVLVATHHPDELGGRAARTIELDAGRVLADTPSGRTGPASLPGSEEHA